MPSEKKAKEYYLAVTNSGMAGMIHLSLSDDLERLCWIGQQLQRHNLIYNFSITQKEHASGTITLNNWAEKVLMAALRAYEFGINEVPFGSKVNIEDLEILGQLETP